MLFNSDICWLINVFICQMETVQPARMCGSMIVTGETTRTGNGTFETLLAAIYNLQSTLKDSSRYIKYYFKM